jgi:hypothetical protein
MEYTDFLRWGLIANGMGLGFIFLADWLIDRAFGSDEE